jgi:hypothetical protein
MKKIWNNFGWEIGISAIGVCFVLSMVFLFGSLVVGSSQEKNISNNEEKVLSLGSVLKNEFIPPVQGKAIRADLGTMKLYLYEEGKIVNEFPILAKGKVGSYWETPGGEYKVLLKKANHFSSTGKVWLPYSMQFFGNYFIHGWPYFPDGTPVPQGFSGGCIRLSIEDMQKVYHWSDVGTYIYIHGGEEKNLASGNYYEKKLSPKLDLSASSYLVGDIDTGEVLAGQDLDKVLSATTLTKLVTAFVELGIVNQQNNAVVSSFDLSLAENQSKLSSGQKLLIAELVYPLIMESDNVAAEVVAAQIGRNYFISQMNETAKSLGLSSTVFVDPSGKSQENLSTARDIFRLGVNLKNYKEFLFNISEKKIYSSDNFVWNGKNRFINEDGFAGGMSDENSALLVFNVPIEGTEGRNIAVVVLGSKDMEGDVSKILEYLKKDVYFK